MQHKQSVIFKLFDVHICLFLRGSGGKFLDLRQHALASKLCMSDCLLLKNTTSIVNYVFVT